MKTLVAYMSQTGNTKKIADVIFEEIKDEKDMKEINDIENFEGYDLVFVGFPIQKFGVPDKVKNLLEKESRNRNVALFVTHAIPKGMEMLEGILAKCKDPVCDANLLGMFDCQGELSKDLAEKLLVHSDPQMRKFGDMRKITIGHPDTSDIENARLYARDIIEKMEYHLKR